MKANNLKDLIMSLTQDVVFKYQGEYACINPWSVHKFEVSYGDNQKTYSDIEDLMSDPIYKGKALNEIAENIELD